MARRIVEAGFPLALWARRPETLQPFSNTAADFAASAEELGSRSDYVGVCVVDDAGVRDVCGTLIGSMRTGGCIAIHATVHPETSRSVEQDAARHGIRVLDAPVSGGQPAAAAGKLTVMVGGEAQDLSFATPVLRSFGELIVHLGPVGAGQEAKLINNALMGAHMALARDALKTGDALGIDSLALARLISASSGQSYAFDVLARLPSIQAFRHGASLLSKDCRLLGEVLPENASARSLIQVAAPLLDAALS